MTTIRASSLPRLMSAPCSVLADGERIEPQNPAGADGSAVHELLAHLVTTGERAFDRVPVVAAKWNADATNVRILFAQAWRIWQAREADYPAPMAEVKLRATFDDVEIPGHADVVSVRDDGVAFCADWKSARVDSSYYWQMFGYAADVMSEWPHVDTVHAEVWWIREGEVEPYTFRRADMPALAARVVDRVERWRPGLWEPGDTCRYCSLAHSCTARHALARADAAAMLDADVEAQIATMDPARAVLLYETAKRLEGMAARVVAALRERAEGGDIIGDAHRLTLTPTAGNRDVDVAKAWTTITDALGADPRDVPGVVSVSLGATEEAVRERAGRGNGAKAVRELAAGLEAAGAVSRTPGVRLEKKRAE